MSDRSHAFIFAGGGTGGHIFPAIAIAEQLRVIDSDCECVFVCSTRPLDSEILAKETLSGKSVAFRTVDARPFGVRPRALWRFVSGWGRSLRESRAIIRDIASKHSSVTVIAMGGFVAAPMAQAARVEGHRLVLVNLDAVPGLANRWISGRADEVFTGSALSDHAPRKAKVSWKTVPPIVRTGAVTADSAQTCRAKMGLDPDRPTLLVTGASQGAGSINELMIEIVRADQRAFTSSGWQIIHQTGRQGADAVRRAYAEAGIPCVVEEFFRGMGVCWRAADLAVSRAGAGSVAEAWANQTPCVFMPYPYHKDEHQRFNAMPIVEANASVLVKDRIDPRLNMADAGMTVTRLLADHASIVRLKEAYSGLGPADGALRIAHSISK